MPFYEYMCKNCGDRFTAMQGIRDKALVHCEKCSHDTLVKLISRTAFDLKGSGWCGTTASNNAKAQERKEQSSQSCSCASCPHNQ